MDDEQNHDLNSTDAGIVDGMTGETTFDRTGDFLDEAEDEFDGDFENHDDDEKGINNAAIGEELDGDETD